MQTTIARFQAPKQRATREYAIIIVETDTEKETKWSVHRAYPEGDMDSGSYDLTEQQAWNEFTKRVTAALGYGPQTWEREWEGLLPA